jgi:hypothetical protein
MAITGQTFATADVVAHQKFYAANYLALIAQMQALNDELVSECVDNSDAQAVGGVKTFSAQPVFSAGINCNSQKAINVLDPTNAQDAATKNYVDTNTATPADRGDPSSDDFTKADLTVDTAWHDLDLSSIVTDSNSTFAILKVEIDNTSAEKYIFFRKNGNTNQYNRNSAYTQVGNIAISFTMTVPMDSNQVIEYKIQNVGTWNAINITVIGWL